MTFPHKIDFKLWAGKVQAMMKLSQRQAGKYRYTQANPESDGLQFALHSALHAVIYRWLDPDMASEELLSATAHQGQAGIDQGRLRYVIDYHEPESLTASEQFPNELPLLAFATVQVYHLTGDYNLLEKMYPRLNAHYLWMERQQIFPTALSFYAAELEALAHIAYDMGNLTEQARWQTQADVLQQRAQAHLKDGVSAVLGLFGGCVAPDRAKGCAERLQRWMAEDAFFILRDSIDYNWIAYMGLRRYEFAKLATELAERTLRLVEQHGFYSNFNYYTGEGSGIPDHPLAGLVLDMLARERQSGVPRSGCT